MAYHPLLPQPKRLIALCVRCGIPYLTQGCLPIDPRDIRPPIGICVCCQMRDSHSPHRRRVRLHDALHAHAGEPPHRIGFGAASRCPQFRLALRLIPDPPLHHVDF